MEGGANRAAGQPAPSDAAPQPASRLECAICYETISESTDLPCSCRISYCGRCWDRALAQSFSSCGQARCPTCRSPIRVDYDAEARQMIFSRETQDFTYAAMQTAAHRSSEHREAWRRGAGSGGRGGVGADAVEGGQVAAPISVDGEGEEEAREQVATQISVDGLPYTQWAEEDDEDEEWEPEQATSSGASNASDVGMSLDQARQSSVERLAWQALPAQVRLLERFGASLREEGAQEPVVEQLSKLSAAELRREQPTCVCGATLRRTLGAQRQREYLTSVLRHNTHEEPGTQYFEARLEAYVRNFDESSIVCDLCGGNIEKTAMVWTCTAGASTILHATSYDICDVCFRRHVFGDAAASRPPPPCAAGAPAGAPA